MKKVAMTVFGFTLVTAAALGCESDEAEDAELSSGSEQQTNEWGTTAVDSDDQQDYDEEMTEGREEANEEMNEAREEAAEELE